MSNETKINIKALSGIMDLLSILEDLQSEKKSQQELNAEKSCASIFKYINDKTSDADFHTMMITEDLRSQVNVTDEYFGNPIIHAIKECEFDKLFILLHHGADPNAYAPVRAIENGKNISLRTTPFCSALLSGLLNVCEMLLHFGTDIFSDVDDFLDLSINGSKMSPLVPLFYSPGTEAKTEPIIILDWYMDKARKANVNIDLNKIFLNNGESLLMTCIREDWFASAYALVNKYNVDVNYMNEKGFTALKMALGHKNPNFVYLLAKFNAEFDRNKPAIGLYDMESLAHLPSNHAIRSRIKKSIKYASTDKIAQMKEKYSVSVKPTSPQSKNDNNDGLKNGHDSDVENVDSADVSMVD